MAHTVVESALFRAVRRLRATVHLAHGGVRVLPGREPAQAPVHRQQGAGDRVPEGRHRTGGGQGCAQVLQGQGRSRRLSPGDAGSASSRVAVPMMLDRTARGLGAAGQDMGVLHVVRGPVECGQLPTSGPRGSRNRRVDASGRDAGQVPLDQAESVSPNTYEASFITTSEA